MTDWPKDTIPTLNAFYGNPFGTPENVSSKWYKENIVRWVPPYPMFYSDAKRTPFSKGLLLHRKCVSTFQTAFADVLDEMGKDAIIANRLNITGGTFCYRQMRGSNRLSTHSFGCAIDMDPEHNPYPKTRDPVQGINLQFASILMRHGFTWLGSSGGRDPMHFQLAH